MRYTFGEKIDMVMNEFDWWEWDLTGLHFLTKSNLIVEFIVDINFNSLFTNFHLKKRFE